jgi:hypothetical protein
LAVVDKIDEVLGVLKTTIFKIDPPAFESSSRFIYEKTCEAAAG